MDGPLESSAPHSHKTVRPVVRQERITVMNDTIRFLTVPLPEDVKQYIFAGQHQAALELIHHRLALLNGEADEPLRRRLELEKARLALLPQEYPYSRQEALSLIRRTIPDFSEGEFNALEAAGRIDFLFVEGQKRYFHRFWETLTATHPDLAERSDPGLVVESRAKSAFRNRTIQLLKEKGELKYRIHLKVGLRIRDEAFLPGSELLVHLPVPKDSCPTCNVRILNTSHKPFFLCAQDAPARTISFRERLQENAAFWVEYEYHSIIRYVQPDPDRISDTQPCFDTGQLPPHIRFTPYLRELTAAVVGQEHNPLLKAKRIYSYITSQVKYSYMRDYFLIDDIAEYCAINKKGDCGVQALLFITMCRIAGIPARWQSGLSVTPASVGPHDWAQFFLAPYGWLHADLSFGGSAFRAGDTARQDFYFGNLDPFRMVANTQFQAPLLPEKKGLRSDPYDNQVGEVEMDGVGLNRSQFENFQKIFDVHSF